MSQATPVVYAGEVGGAGVSVPTTAPANQRSIPVAASATNFTLQTVAGAAGDYLGVLMIVPGNTSPGAVTYKDGSGASRTAFPGGASSVLTLAPIPFIVDGRSEDGAWSVTTGANVTVQASGDFS